MSEKRFSDWCEVNCEDCARYWDNSCDGVKKGSSRPCNSFLATRSIVIPEQIKALQKSVKWLYWCFVLVGAALILHVIASWL